MNEEFMNKCYECKWRGGVLGSAHSTCAHPKRNAIDLGIKASAHGIKMGWFYWPYNFDPVWLENCDGFNQKEVGK